MVKEDITTGSYQTSHHFKKPSYSHFSDLLAGDDGQSAHYTTIVHNLHYFQQDDELLVNEDILRVNGSDFIITINLAIAKDKEANYVEIQALEDYSD